LRRGALTAFVTAGALSCLSRPALVPQLYTLDPPLERASSSAGRGRAVVVRRVTVAAPFEGRELVYRTGPHRLERDPYATLVATPAALLADAVRERLGLAGFVGEAADPSGAPAPALPMDVDLRELSGDFVHPDQPAAVIVVAFEVRPAAATAPLFRKVYARRSALPHRTADAVVTAWNAELADVLGELERDLDAALARSAPLGPSTQ
jgi:uncharacterized lipoprotein YmbA